jgi:hypothetical protein
VTHDELLAKLSNDENGYAGSTPLQRVRALRAVVELHKPTYDFGNGHCLNCAYAGGELMSYPCLTIQAIEKELV